MDNIRQHSVIFGDSIKFEEQLFGLEDDNGVVLFPDIFDFGESFDVDNQNSGSQLYGLLDGNILVCLIIVFDFRD